MNLKTALIAGAAGAIVLTLVHETARHVSDDAPRVDIIGERALAKGMRAMNMTPPRGNKLYASAMALDLISNTLYYALVGIGSKRYVFTRGALLGAAGGLGTIVLSPLLGLGRKERGTTTKTQAMTLSWYLLGGFAAATVARILGRR